MNRTIEQWADFWRYEIGVNVIPANTKYKKPIVQWTEWQDKPIPKETHEKWKHENLFKNGMAVIVGKVWHNNIKRGLYLCAIDCDNQKAIEDLMPKGVLEYSKKTLVEFHSDDSTKCHIYFYTNNPVPKKSSDTVNPKQSQQLRNNEIPALEVKGDGKHGIMYVTPSAHKNGTKYEIINAENPMLLNEIPIVIDRICRKYGINYLDTIKNNNSLIPMGELLGDETEILEGHNRHLALLRYADHVYRVSPSSITDKMVFEMIQAKNKLMCKPSLDVSEINKIQAQAKSKVDEWKKQENEKSVDEKTEIKTHSNYADEIMNSYEFATLEDTDEIMFYSEGVYISNGEVLIKKQCEQIIEDCTNAMVNEVISTIKRRTYINRSDFDSEPNMLNLKNCWLDIETGETFKHSPTRLSKVQIPVFFDPEKTSFRFIRFLKECLPRPKDAYTVIEQFAACLIKSAKFSKSFMYVGQGSNGKSVFLNVIKHVLGHGNVSNISIHAIENNRFSPAELDGKLANIYFDISNEELNSTGTFKNIVVGDPIQVEKKNKNPFTLENYAKMFFSANQIPIVYDESDGFFRRFMITEWNTKFTDKTANVNLIFELTTEEEKSGILNMLIRMASQLNKRGYFKYADSVEKLRTKWKNKADSVGGFLEKEMIYDDALEVEKKHFYNAYVDYCTKNKLFALARKKFQDEIKANSPLEDKAIPSRINRKEPSWRYCKSDEDKKTVRVWGGGMLKADVRLVDSNED